MSRTSEISTLLSALKAQKTSALARVISLLEDSTEHSNEIIDGLNSILEALAKEGGKSSFVIGITGLPGSGKSTLVDRLALSLSQGGEKVAILAIDPSSPLSGGAVLGDRIRMQNSTSSPRIYGRSLASRGASGGVSPQIKNSILAVKAAGFKWILVETVGVGQGEIEIMHSADCIILVSVPGLGDEVQSLKAGILEIADIFVINKADRKGVDLLNKDLLFVAESRTKDAWKPPVVETIAIEGKGTAELKAEINNYLNWKKLGR